jgi:hypothetical protein
MKTVVIGWRARMLALGLWGSVAAVGPSSGATLEIDAPVVKYLGATINTTAKAVPPGYAQLTNTASGVANGKSQGIDEVPLNVPSTNTGVARFTATSPVAASVEAEVIVVKARLREINRIDGWEVHSNASPNGWGFGGSLGTQLWSNGAANPACYTASSNVTIAVTLELAPPIPAGQTLSGTLQGQTGSGAFAGYFSSDTKQMSGSNAVFSFTNTLPNCVAYLASSVSWTLQCDGISDNLGATPLTIFLTLSNPPSSVNLTSNRLYWAIVTASNTSNTVALTCVTNIFAGFQANFSSTNGTPTNTLWVIAGGTKADCEGLSKFCKEAAELLGLTGGSITYVYPGSNNVAFEKPYNYGSITRDVPSTCPETHRTGIIPNEYIQYQDGMTNLNNFECCFKYSGLYFAPGASVYPSAQAVITNVVAQCVWVYRDTNGVLRVCDPASGGTGPKPAW